MHTSAADRNGLRFDIDDFCVCVCVCLSYRRTADVRSVGYSELIVLSRDDVLAALKDHPDAEVSHSTYDTIRYTRC